MSKKERERKVMMEQVLAGHFTLVEAAQRLKISYRQGKRCLKKYREEGDQGLVHQRRGQRSNRAFPEPFKDQVLQRYQQRYFGFGPTFAAEKLAEDDQLCLHAETLRGWLKEAGLWTLQRKRSAHRQQRPRRERFGELLQLDGSHHAWFGAEHPHSCLMNLVDDATGITLAQLHPQETTQAAMEILWAWIKLYGIPKALYVDLKTVYVSPKNIPKSEEDNSVSEGFTHFDHACQKLGIEIIKAYSPQAKGRVERKHAVFQDRFVKELALQNITSLPEANSLLKPFLKSINQKFARLPASSDNAHRATQPYGDLNQIFCWQYTRQLQKDWSFQFQQQHYQLPKASSSFIKPKQKLLIRHHLNGSISAWAQDQQLAITPIPKPQPKLTTKHGPNLDLIRHNARKYKHKSPWSTFNPQWLKQQPKAYGQDSIPVL